MSELEEIRFETYESAISSKESAKLVHDRMISLNMKVLLYDLRLHLFSYKLESRLTYPFSVTHIFPYGVVEI